MKLDRAVTGLAVGQILTWAGLYYIFPAMLVRWEHALGWTKADLTAAITMAIFVSAIASPFAGRMIDRGNGPLLMATSTLLGGLCLFSLSWVNQLIYFYFVWGLIGVTLAGCLYEPCFSLLVQTRGKNAKQGIIAITLIAGFASAISFPAVHFLTQLFGWRVTVQIFACVVVFVGTPLMWIAANLIELSVDNPGVGEEHRSLENRRFLTRPVFWLLGIGFALSAVIHGITLHHLLPLLYERNIHPDIAVAIASFIGPLQVAGRLALMATQDHLSNHGIAMSCFIVMGCSVLVLYVSGTNIALLWAFVVLFGGGYGIVSIIRPVIASEILGDRNFGAKSGALALLYLLGSGSAPYLGSVIWGLGGYDLVLPILILLAVMGLILYIAAHHLSRGN